jgi:caffeoyl-CoA O-methyltransferase
VIIDPQADAYATSHTTPAGALLDALERETHESLDAPQMLTGRVEGRFLQTLVWLAGARSVLEIGTYSGYSALSMASGLPPGGRIVTCELDPERAAFAQRHIDGSPHADAIEIRVGPALETVRALEGPWDLVFIDADKTGYPDYFDAVLPKLSERGLVVLDNTLRSGSVLDPDPQDEAAVAMAKLNDRLAQDPALVTTMLTVRDGVTLVRRAP